MAALGVGLLLNAPAGADVWDVQTQNDNGNGTQNELVHGSDQLHDLGALAGPVADQDWFRISQKPFSSYEVVADTTSGDIGNGLGVTLVDSGGATITASSDVGVGFSKTLRFVNATASAVDTQFVRVTAACGTTCAADDVYRIRSYETTYAIPRFNNSGTQTTVLIVQNPTNYTIAGTVYFWNAAGTLLNPGGFAINLTGKQTQVLSTSSVGGVAGQSGAITLSHNGRYGDLAGKAVALEPSTGFSFDTPMVPRPH
jgi:hypothetical protein